LNNLLVNLKGQPLAFHEIDLLREHFNLWLEDYLQKHGGDFDDHFFRNLIAPNVFHFLSIKYSFQTAFELTPRSKSHTSPNSVVELKTLLTSYEQQELHKFCSGRTMGHAATDILAKGYDVLDMGKLDSYLTETTETIDILRLVLSSRGESDASSITSVSTDNSSLSDNPTSDCTTEDMDSGTSSSDSEQNDSTTRQWRGRKEQCGGIVGDEDNAADTSDESNEESLGGYNSDCSEWIIN
jgi:hypothetical protein